MLRKFRLITVDNLTLTVFFEPCVRILNIVNNIEKTLFIYLRETILSSLSV